MRQRPRKLTIPWMRCSDSKICLHWCPMERLFGAFSTEKGGAISVGAALPGGTRRPPRAPEPPRPMPDGKDNIKWI